MPLPLIFDHDGGADDLLSLLLLLSMEAYELQLVSITPADCYAEDAALSTAKILHKFGKPEVPISVGRFHGVNPFPSAWRVQPRAIHALPMLINEPPEPNAWQLPDSRQSVVQVLKNSTQPVTVLMTGPCSNLVAALEQHPELKQKVGRVVWMAGAVAVAGNVSEYNHDGSAEWNVFWDPYSAKKLLQMGLDLLLVPLDATNQVPVAISFLKRLAALPAEKAQLAGQIWATTTTNIPTAAYTYYMWDVLATAFLGIPEAFTQKKAALDVAIEAPNAGETFGSVSGSNVSYAAGINKEYFYRYLLAQFAGG